MLEKVLTIIAVLNTVNSQLYPVTIPCQRGQVATPMYARVRAVPSSSLAIIPSILTEPRPVIPNTNIALPQQHCPLEYSVIGPSVPAPLPTPLTEPCYSPVPYPDYILPDYTNDLYVPEPVFDILGCLDPLLTRYGTISEVLVPEIPCPLISPFLPAASPVSAFAPPVSPLLPPALPSECSCHFLKKIAIPPPFI